MAPAGPENGLSIPRADRDVGKVEAHFVVRPESPVDGPGLGVFVGALNLHRDPVQTVDGEDLRILEREVPLPGQGGGESQ